MQLVPVLLTRLDESIDNHHLLVEWYGFERSGSQYFSVDLEKTLAGTRLSSWIVDCPLFSCLYSRWGRVEFRFDTFWPIVSEEGDCTFG